MITTLFLDFDGVLHPCGAHQDSKQLFCCIPLFENFLRKHKHVEVVLSTSWRRRYELDENRARFSSDVAQRIIGSTPDRADESEVPEMLWSYSREAECWLWVRQNRPPYTPWLAIDDESWRFTPFCEQLYLTNAETGLMPQDILNLGERLGELSS